MKKGSLMLLLVSLLIVLSACENQGDAPVALTSFAGGTEGVRIAFKDMQSNVFDRGTYPFDIFVEVENVGEQDIQKSDIEVRIVGFEQFENKDGTKKNTDENLIGVKKDPQGNIIPGFPILVPFTSNYLDPVTTLAEFSVAASACYQYGTRAVTTLCVRSDIQNPEPNGLCVINEGKPFSSSGAPIQIRNVVEQPSGSSKIQFKFDVVHTGGGIVYQQGHDCSAIRAKQNKVVLSVDTKMGGTTCTQLTTRKGTAVEGEIDLGGAGTRTIFCTVPIDRKSDYEFLVNMNAKYAYEITTPVQKIIVKESS